MDALPGLLCYIKEYKAEITCHLGILSPFSLINSPITVACKIRKIGKDNEVDRMLNEHFVSPVRTGYVEAGEDNYVLPIYYEKYVDEIRNFEVRDDDIIVAGHVKTGTTWTYEMVWLLRNNPDCEDDKMPTRSRPMPAIEAVIFLDADKINKDIQLDMSRFDNARLESPRSLKTHLPWSLLPEQIKNGTKEPKIIVTLRNPHDTCVSYYYYSKLAHGYTGNFEEFCRLFMAGRVCFGPFWAQILSFWEERARANVLFVKFKDMKEDLPAVIKKVAQFIGKALTDDQIEKLAYQLSFESMRNNPALNQEHKKFFRTYKLTTKEGEFMRCGKEGAYKADMTPELIEKFDAWTEKNTAGTGLSFE